jgi:transcriptional regulator with XRE-family HTH domain
MIKRVIKRKKVSKYKFRKILKLFSFELNAKQIAEITGLNRNTINRYLRFIREQIAQICEDESLFIGEVKVDESFFGAKHIKGKRGRGAYGKTVVFGILNVMKRCILKSFQSAPDKHYKLL